MEIKRVLITAGGTGGHVFPGIAVAKLLQERGIEVVWLGTQKGLDAKLVPEANIPFYPVSIQGLRGKGKLSLLLAPFKILKALLHSMKIIRQTKADVILGMGGYVSGPAGLAAFLLRKPLYIHEQNAIAGMTNRFLSRFAKGVLTAFPKAFSRKISVIETGNPIRMDLLHLQSPEQRFANRGNPLRLLVIGGSQGAGFLNRLVLEMHSQFDESELQICHQTGIKDFEFVKEEYRNHGSRNITVKAFIDDMPAVYSWADIVLCRSGALTVSELAAVGIGSILVPFSHAVDDHQTHNAWYLAEAGAAIVIPEKELTAERLSHLLKEFREDRHSLLEMANAASQLAKRDATEVVVNAVLGIEK
jgi:UDP-N-acetylglucosamine--N-acetylmuramyl-(pentapeptide) pyrophosphoryl-undecaprenol N-acetylglucosamine transferase